MKKPNIADDLLVSCPGQSGGMVYVNAEDCIVTSNTASTGVSLDNEFLVWGQQEDGGRRITLFEGPYVKEFELSNEPMDIHDIILVQGGLYVVATENNAVVQYDKNFDVVDRWQLPGEPDSAHLNSIAFYQGRLIGSIFGRFETHRGYKNGTKGLGQVIDIVSGETIIEGLSQPHSLNVAGETLYLCSSEDMELHTYDGAALGKNIVLPGYARGVAVGGKYLYVGVSLSRNVDDDKHKLSSGSIAVLNRDSLQVVEIIPIPFREIYDICIVNDHLNITLFLQAQISSLGQIIVMQKARIASLEQSVANSMGELETVRNSYSWRVTRGLRTLARTIGHRRKQ